VKPFEMICEVRARSVEQRAQRRCDLWPWRYWAASPSEDGEPAPRMELREEGPGGELDGEEEDVVMLELLDWRRRKGMEGRR
jgi:hypothetical protein